MTIRDDEMRVIEAAAQTMGDQHRAEDWLDRPQERWGGSTPFSLIESGRTDEVLAALAGAHEDALEDELLVD